MVAPVPYARRSNAAEPNVGSPPPRRYSAPFQACRSCVPAPSTEVASRAGRAEDLQRGRGRVELLHRRRDAGRPSPGGRTSVAPVVGPPPRRCWRMPAERIPAFSARVSPAGSSLAGGERPSDDARAEQEAAAASSATRRARGCGCRHETIRFMCNRSRAAKAAGFRASVGEIRGRAPMEPCEPISKIPCAMDKVVTLTDSSARPPAARAARGRAGPARAGAGARRRRSSSAAADSPAASTRSARCARSTCSPSSARSTSSTSTSARARARSWPRRSPTV